MNEMIVRVARAIFQNERKDGDWHSLNKNGQDYYCECAKAAIAAMREPTEEMLFAGDDQLQEMMSAIITWEKMIDAALKED